MEKTIQFGLSNPTCDEQNRVINPPRIEWGERTITNCEEYVPQVDEDVIHALAVNVWKKGDKYARLSYVTVGEIVFVANNRIPRITLPFKSKEEGIAIAETLGILLESGVL